MLYLYGFQKVGVVISDLFFVDPNPIPGQESPERGVRVEVRLLEQGTADGTIYAARPIRIDQPIWRADLFESVDGPSGSFDRTHHHPRFNGWEPGTREFVAELSENPFPWVGRALSDLASLVAEAGLPPDAIDVEDQRQLDEALPEILTTMARLMEKVRAGELATSPTAGDLTSVRQGWL